MTPERALYTALLLSVCGSVSPTRSVAAEEYRPERVFHRAVVIQDNQFSSASIRRRAEMFAREVGDRYAVAWLDIETPSSHTAYWRPAPESGTLEQFRENQQRLSKTRLNRARVFVRSGRAVLQSRYESGVIEHTVLGNYDDPLVFRIGTCDLKLVLAGVKRCSALNRSLPSDNAFACNTDTVELYFRTSRLPSRVEVADIWNYIRNEVGTDSLSLTIRRVAWCDQTPILSAPPFEDAAFTQCRDWKEEPILAVTRSAKGVIKYLLLDGRANRFNASHPGVTSAPGRQSGARLLHYRCHRIYRFRFKRFPFCGLAPAVL
jgi:hypothetical protein